MLSNNFHLQRLLVRLLPPWNLPFLTHELFASLFFFFFFVVSVNSSHWSMSELSRHGLPRFRIMLLSHNNNMPFNRQHYTCTSIRKPKELLLCSVRLTKPTKLKVIACDTYCHASEYTLIRCDLPNTNMSPQPPPPKKNKQKNIRYYWSGCTRIFKPDQSVDCKSILNIQRLNSITTFMNSQWLNVYIFDSRWTPTNTSRWIVALAQSRVF